MKTKETKETKVYVVDTTQEIKVDNYFDDLNSFMYVSEKQGNVYSLQGFQNAFNNEEINSNTDLIKLI